MKAQILEILDDAEPGYWPGYESISDTLKESFNIEASTDEVKTALKELYQIGLVRTEGIVDGSTGMMKGSGYFTKRKWRGIGGIGKEKIGSQMRSHISDSAKYMWSKAMAKQLGVPTSMHNNNNPKPNT